MLAVLSTELSESRLSDINVKKVVVTNKMNVSHRK